jgi:hypothetical protein
LKLVTLVKGYMTDKPLTYADLEKLRDGLDQRHSELIAEIEDVNRKLESVTTTIALLREQEMPLSHRVARLRRSIEAHGLRGLTQVQALTKIAENNGGILQSAHAKTLLLQAGLIRNPKNAANILFSVIQRSEKFERVSPGVYRLIGYNPPEEKQHPEPTSAVRTLSLSV